MPVRPKKLQDLFGLDHRVRDTPRCFSPEHGPQTRGSERTFSNHSYSVRLLSGQCNSRDVPRRAILRALLFTRVKHPTFVGLGRLLVLAGVVLIGLGAVVLLLGRLNVPLGRMPGDILWRGKNTTVYFPIVTCLVLSLLGTLLLWLFSRRP